MDVVSAYFVRRNFDGQKIDVTLTYFVRLDLDGKISASFSRNLINIISTGKNIDVISIYLFDLILIGEKLTLFRYIFLCRFDEWIIDSTSTVLLKGKKS